MNQPAGACSDRVPPANIARNHYAPSVQYGYSEAAGGVNHSRLTNMTYPDGRVLSYDYGSANSTSDRISRLACITESTGTLESYEYLGLATVVIRSHPQADVSLSYLIYAPLAHGEAGDIYSGLDRFGRVVDQRWVQGNGTEIDRFQYGYDRNSNRLWRDNLMNTSFGELYGYDNLGQLTSMQRGELDGNRTGIVGNASRSQDWAYDPLGNWNGVTTDGVEESRTHDAQNRVVGVGNTTLAFDAAGNMLTDEQGQQYAYDAWNRLKTVWDSGNTVIASYEYDALRRRVVETHGNETKTLYYSSQWQVLEERDAATGNTTMSYAWSPVYVDAMIERDRDTDGNGSLDERLWVQQDANWNVTSLLLANGTVGERYAYDAYGVQTIYSPTYGTVRSVSDYSFNQGFQGIFLDATTGTLKSRGRTDYDPELGRTLQSDPLGLGPDVNSYRWEGGSPGNFVDPSGLQKGVDGYGIAIFVGGWNVLFGEDGTTNGLIAANGHFRKLADDYQEVIRNRYPASSKYTYEQRKYMMEAAHHTMWQMLTTIRYGTYIANLAGNLHEAGCWNTLDSVIDRYHNREARSSSETFRKWFLNDVEKEIKALGPLYKSVGATDEQIRTIAEGEAWRKHEAYYLRKVKRYIDGEIEDQLSGRPGTFILDPSDPRIPSLPGYKPSMAGEKR